jgi:hypothetical protein
MATRRALERSWAITTKHLRAAIDALARVTLSERSRRQVEDARSFLRHNELEVAMDVLGDAAEEADAPASFWEALAAAARRMELHDRASEFHDRAVGAGGAVSGAVNKQRLVRLSAGTWAVVASMLIVVLVSVGWALLHPALYAYDCEHRYLPARERALGFHGGPAAIPGSQGTVYVLVHVDPAGPLGRAGFRSGDVPVFQHGGLADFCAAVRDAEAGRGRDISLINVGDTVLSRRRVAVPPLGPEPPRPR